MWIILQKERKGVGKGRFGRDARNTISNCIAKRGFVLCGDAHWVVNHEGSL